MNITLSLDEKLVKEVRKIAVERDTTLTGMVRAYLEEVAAGYTNADKVRQDQERFLETFERLKRPLGRRNWKREDLYVRGRQHDQS